VTDLIADYLTGTLDPETTSAFEEHLRDCLDCVAFLHTYKITNHMVRSLRCEEIPSEMEEWGRRFLEAMRARDDCGPPSISL
jgi:anti-sigma factor RsiW